MKPLAFAELCELAGQNRFDVLWLLGDEKAATKEDDFNGVWTLGRGLAEEPGKVVDETVCILHTHSAYGNFES